MAGQEILKKNCWTRNFGKKLLLDKKLWKGITGQKIVERNCWTRKDLGKNLLDKKTFWRKTLYWKNVYKKLLDRKILITLLNKKNSCKKNLLGQEKI